MFRNPGLRTGDKTFGFLGHDGELIVKVPRIELGSMSTGNAEQVTMGKRTMREWVVFAA
ncbi:hypothetical protein ACGFNP_34295 [Nonomuraea sp. NPDC049269]|uniref:hypothetical protein n=1 Tax=Nonomuraea sp. NPDC049269 TaxID=3364349 RepID=UPI003710A6A1